MNDTAKPETPAVKQLDQSHGADHEVSCDALLSPALSSRNRHALITLILAELLQMDEQALEAAKGILRHFVAADSIT